MASPTIIDPDGGEPEVTVHGTNLIRYDCIFTLWKPKGETWPETGERGKVIHEVTLNQHHAPTDTFSLGPADELDGLTLTWDIDMIVPGGGGPLQFTVSVRIDQDGNEVMDPEWEDMGKITDVKATSNKTKLRFDQ